MHVFVLERLSPTEHLLRWICRRQHRGAVWGSSGRRSRHSTAPGTAPGRLAVARRLKMLSSDWRSTVLFFWETSNTVGQDTTSHSSNSVVYKRFGSGFPILFLQCLHIHCYLLFSNQYWGLSVADWGGQEGTGQDTRMDMGQTTWKSFTFVHSLYPQLNLGKPLPPHQVH